MIKTILKFALAFAIIFWLWNSGKIDFGLIAESAKNPVPWLIGLLLLLVQILCATYRWKLILETKIKTPLNFPRILGVEWIGLFFNTILPGAVTGDLVKLLYAKDLSPGIDKTFLVTSALMDRILGLFGLISLLGLSSMLFYSPLISMAPGIRELIHLNFLLFLGMIVFIICMFLPARIQEVFLGPISRIPKLGNQARKTLEQIWIIGQYKKVVIFCIVLSMCAQSLMILAFWNIASPFFGKGVPLQYAFTFIPAGLITIAIPIFPNGLGIGHAVFDKLFMFFGVVNGASLFNFYFLLSMLVNMVGLIPYLTFGKRHSLKEAEEFN